MAYIFDLVDTWASGGGPYTSIKMNATDNDVGSASLLMDLQVGGSSKFSVTKAGNFSSLYLNTSATRITALTPLWLGSSSLVAFSSSFNPDNAAVDLILTRRAAANLRFGAADAAAPVAQTLSVQSVVAGTTNTAGTNLTITGSQGTGTGAGGNIIFQVAPAGSTGTAQNGLVPALTIGSDRNLTMWGNGAALYFEAASGFEYFGSGTIAVRAGGARAMAWKVTGSGQALMGSGAVFGFASGAAESTALDTILARDAANTLALRNGTAAQTFNLYNTYSNGGVDYERVSLLFDSGVAALVFNAGGSGAIRNFQLGGTASGTNANILIDNSNKINFRRNSTNRWLIDDNGHFLAGADNTYDIGAATTTRPRSVYAGTNVIAGGYLAAGVGSAVFFGGNSRSRASSSADGLIELGNSAGTDFGRLNFGGTTSSFPALKRSSTTLQARLADDSAFAPVQGKITTDTAYTAGAPTATGYLVVYDSAGTAYRIPAVLN